MLAKTAVSAQPPQSPREREAAREDQERRAGWLFLLILFGFKLGTVIAIIAAARSEESIVLAAATTWYWLPIPLIALGGALTFRWRLRRVRRRREQLRRAEWLLEEPERLDSPVRLP